MVMNRSKQLLWSGVGFLMILIAWQSVIWIFKLPQFLVPTPLSVVFRGVELGEAWLPHIWGTVSGTLAGFFIALIFGFLVAIIIVHSRILNLVLTPVLLLFQVIPKMALAPIILIWAGIGFGSRVTVVTLLTFFPIVINTVAGLQSIEPEFIELARSLHMSRWQILWKIRIPHALPQIFSGLRVASTLATIGSIIAEFVGAQEGLGYLISSAGYMLDTALQFAALGILTVFGVTFYGLIVLIEKISMPWHVAQVEMVEIVS